MVIVSVAVYAQLAAVFFAMSDAGKATTAATNAK
jgi:hypothetical protein